ncbi:MAG: hypothetical protein AAF682_20085 [Planctomycetota bacterium]
MKRMLLALAFASLAALPARSGVGGGCLFSDLSTADFGAGSGLLQPSVIGFGLNPSACTLEWKIDAPTCCNVLVSQHFLVVGTAQDPVGVKLGPPFFAGSALHVGTPAFVLGPFAGQTGGVPLPPDPALVGNPLPVQGVVEFFTTIGLTVEYGMTQGVLLKMG